MPGASLPAIACKGTKEVHTSIQVQSNIPTFPAQWLRLMPCSLSDEFVLSYIIGELTALRTRSGLQSLRRLDTSNGCGTTRFCRTHTAPFVYRAGRSLTDPKSALHSFAPAARHRISPRRV